MCIYENKIYIFILFVILINMKDLNKILQSILVRNWINQSIGEELKSNRTHFGTELKVRFN